MDHPPSESNLAKQHYVTLIVRLMIDDQGQVIHGEMMDDSRTLRKRFTSGAGLISLIQAWLTTHKPDDGDGSRPRERK